MKRSGLQAISALALCSAFGACDNSGLVDYKPTGLGGAGAGPAASAGAGTSPGGSAGTPSGGSGGASGGGTAGSGSEPLAQCPADDGTAAALTLAGLGLSLPAAGEDAGVSDAGWDGGGDAAASDAGSVPLEFAGLALPELLGWATRPGLGTATTIGGAAGQVVTARTPEELVAYASSPEPLVIRICGTLRAPTVRVASHKTLLGVGPAATLEGGLLVGGDSSYSRNIVIKNLRVNGAYSAVVREAVRVERAHHVWIDHLELFDTSGEAELDIVSGSDLVTVSWSKFHFTPDTPDSEHRFGCRIGDHNEADAIALAEDKGHLNVTLHHNWFADDVRQRAPRVRFGSVHLFNNYYSVGTRVNDWSIWASTDSRVLLESNYFQGVNNPHELNTVDAQLLSRNNVYDGATGSMQSTGAAFTPPYSYVPDSTLSLPDVVTARIGPR
jgi:pectate lyase